MVDVEFMWVYFAIHVFMTGGCCIYVGSMWALGMHVGVGVVSLCGLYEGVMDICIGMIQARCWLDVGMMWVRCRLDVGMMWV